MLTQHRVTNGSIVSSLIDQMQTCGWILMRIDGAFRIYEISYEIRPGKCRYSGVKENKIETSIISFSTSALMP